MISYVERLIVEHGVLIIDKCNAGGMTTHCAVSLQKYVGQQQVVVTEHDWTSDILQQCFQRFDISPQALDASNECIPESMHTNITHVL